MRLGPLGYREFLEFMPGSGSLRSLCQFIRRYVGRELDFDVQVLLLREEVPQTSLGEGGESSSRLGWNTWLTSRPPGRDADEAVFVDEGLPAEGRNRE